LESVARELSPVFPPPTRFHQRLFAEELALQTTDAARQLAPSLCEAHVDLNPHQVEAAAFALDSLRRGGCMLADEVGLGKTIEAGILIAQLVAERKSRILVLCPASLRAQWQLELQQKFNLRAAIVEGRPRSGFSPWEQPGPLICSLPYAAIHAGEISKIGWNLVVIDEAHRLRNSHRPNHKTGQALRGALKNRAKLLLTATPLQNHLLELFGMLSFLDERILGPEAAFKAQFSAEHPAQGLSEKSAGQLKERLAPVIQRTLRRQVREYVRFTRRRSIVEDFEPTPEEQDLYERVSEYLRRSAALSLTSCRRTLLTLVYRKLLASSTYAIAPTLSKLAEGLKLRLGQEKLLAGSSPPIFEPEDLENYPEEEEEWLDSSEVSTLDPSERAPRHKLKQEIAELERYAALASKIRVNAKGEALKRALDRAFTVARAHQWPEKAVVFTESRRTQQYLHQLLSDHGYRGRISLLSGDGASPAERLSLIEEFRDRTQILISTEAGGEGLNLQFCNLVVNYDLPWNPQRIEQRIGRCHRYGQQRDVVVINFLNRKNAADARLYELLEKKLRLFDGVFGASDEILGGLESGIDFEKRILQIYQSCRSPEEIDAAYDRLRAELEERIDDRMLRARSILMDRFDADVRQRMRIANERTQEAVAAHRYRTKALISSLGLPVAERDSVDSAVQAIRARPAEPPIFLQLDSTYLPPQLSHLAVSEGWWFAYRFTVGGLRPEEKLVHLILTREREGFRALPPTDSDCFLQLPAREEFLRRPASTIVADAQAVALSLARDEIVRRAEQRSFAEADSVHEQLDRYAEDCLFEARQSLEEARVGWEAARQALKSGGDPDPRLKARAQLQKLDREYRRKLDALRAAEDVQYAEKDRTIDQLTQGSKVAERHTLVASAYFWVSPTFPGELGRPRRPSPESRPGSPKSGKGVARAAHRPRPTEPPPR
jgi:superfamily II DNA or RNA helicase